MENSKSVARSQNPVEYIVNALDDETIIAKALAVLSARIKTGSVMASPSDVVKYLMLEAAKHDGIEVFSVLFLDSQHRVIEFREMFRGTLTQTSVYPREVVRAALELNSACVVLSHNHPSGSTSPSRADEFLTQTLKAALALIDTRVLDHIIIAGNASSSMAGMGLM